jgi:Na+-transporting NADH:ubiquinone oxidoreductase subunit NqrA
MLGEQYAELKGKITSQRVLDVAGPTIETSVSTTGTVKGTQVQEMITFIGTPTGEKGVIHGVGKGVLLRVVEKEKNQKWQHTRVRE